jgi:alcohol dehydrogenase YqhD (iron-dependent ADH family)
LDDFEFLSPTKIIFGRNTVEKVGVEAARWGRKALLHYGGKSALKSGLIQRVKNSLIAQDIKVIEVGGVVPNPRLALVRECIDLVRKEKIDLIIAVGGGSVIDSAKGIAMGAVYEGDVWDFYRGKIPEVALPIGAVLTIPAAGSEASNSSVITDTDSEGGWRKLGAKGEAYKPKFAILDPELTYTLPAYQTAAGGVDIMAHVMERYFTNTPDVDLTSRLCEGVLKTMIQQLPIALAEPENYAARAQIMWASTLAHNGLLDTGRATDWASHRMEHELSAKWDVTHGAGLAVMFPAWMKYVSPKKTKQFVEFGNRVFGLDVDVYHPERTAREGISRLEAFFKSLGMPTSIRDLVEGEVTDDDLRSMAERCAINPDGTLGGLVKLTREDIYQIYKLAY